MISLRSAVVRTALIGAFVGPGLLSAYSTATHAASAVTITIAYDAQAPDNNGVWWKSISPAIEAANPGIKINLEPIVASEGDYYTKIDLMMRSASTAPDLVYEDSFLVGSDATAGYIAPLDKYLAAWPEYKQQWYPAMQTITTFNGHNYGVMNGTDVQNIWYNKVLFKKAGLPTTWQPKTWADILAAANTIKAKVPGVIPINIYSGIPADEASTMRGFENFLYGTKDPLYNYATNKWVASSQGILDSLNFLAQVYNPKKMLGPDSSLSLNANIGNIVAQQLLPTGKLAIDVDGSWLPSYWCSTCSNPWAAWQSTLGNAKIPTQYGQAPGVETMSGGWAYSISSKTPHPDQAWTVLKAANSLANLAQFDRLVGNIGPRKDEVTIPAYNNIPLNSLFTSFLAFTHFRPGFPAYPKISNQIDLAMENVMSGTSPKDSMAGFLDAVKGIAGASNVEVRPAK